MYIHIHTNACSYYMMIIGLHAMLRIDYVHTQHSFLKQMRSCKWKDFDRVNIFIPFMTIFLVINGIHENSFIWCLHDLVISPILRYIPSNFRSISLTHVLRLWKYTTLVDRKHRVYKISLSLLISLCFFFSFFYLCW